MKAIQSLLMLTLSCIFLAACVSPIKITPFSQAKLPLLKDEKSRVYFMHAGNIGYAVVAKVINDENDEVLVYLSPLECTYIDYDPGIHRFRAGHNSLGPNEIVTELTTEPKKTYYMVWWWNRDRRIGFHGSERGSHFMNLKSEQGEEMINYCNYKTTLIKTDNGKE